MSPRLLFVTYIHADMSYPKSVVEYVNTLPIGEEYVRIFGEQLPDRNFFCPFHHNVNTPSAKVYGNTIKCFSCNRSYGTFSLLWKFNKKRIEELIAGQVFPELRRVVKPHGKVVFIPREQLDIPEVLSVEFLDKLANYGS